MNTDPNGVVDGEYVDLPFDDPAPRKREEIPEYRDPPCLRCNYPLLLTDDFCVSCGLAVDDTARAPTWKVLPVFDLEYLDELLASTPAVMLEGLVPFGEYGVVSGGTNVFKTTWCYELFMAMALGFPAFEDVPLVGAPAPAIMVSGEGSELAWGRRVRSTVNRLKARHQWPEDLNEVFEPQLVYETNRKMLSEGHYSLADKVLDEARKYPKMPGIFVFDPMSALGGFQKANDEEEAERWYANAKRVQTETGATVISVVHQSKEVRQDGARDASFLARGSSRIVDSAQFAVEIMVTKRQKGDVRIAAREGKDKLSADDGGKTRYRVNTFPAGTDPNGFELRAPFLVKITDEAEQEEAKANEAQQRHEDAMLITEAIHEAGGYVKGDVNLKDVLGGDTSTKSKRLAFIRKDATLMEQYGLVADKAGNAHQWWTQDRWDSEHADSEGED